MTIINSKAKEAGIQGLVNIKQTAKPLQPRKPAIPVPSDVNETALYIKNLSANKQEDLKYHCKVF
jgi:hypothetical protein